MKVKKHSYVREIVPSVENPVIVVVHKSKQKEKEKEKERSSVPKTPPIRRRPYCSLKPVANGIRLMIRLKWYTVITLK